MEGFREIMPYLACKQIRSGRFLGNAFAELKSCTKASSEVENAMILAEALENHDAEPTGWPVHIISRDG